MNYAAASHFRNRDGLSVGENLLAGGGEIILHPGFQLSSVVPGVTQREFVVRCQW